MTIDLDKLRELIIQGSTDFYCLRCRYNLRALEGENKTCPECGTMNTVPSQWFNNNHLLHQLEKLESIPTFFLASIFGTQFSLPVILYYWDSLDSIIYKTIVTILCILPIIACLLFLSIFLKQCNKDGNTRREALRVLLRGALIVSLGLAIILVSYYTSLLFYVNYGHSDGTKEWVRLLIFLAISGLGITILKAPYDGYKRKLDALHRNHALYLIFKLRKEELMQISHENEESLINYNDENQ